MPAGRHDGVYSILYESTHRDTASPKLARLACPHPITGTVTRARHFTCSSRHACSLPKPNPQSPPEGVDSLRAGGYPRTHPNQAVPAFGYISHTSSRCAHEPLPPTRSGGAKRLGRDLNDSKTRADRGGRAGSKQLVD